MIPTNKIISALSLGKNIKVNGYRKSVGVEYSQKPLG
jgi:hypothetical protein